MLIVPAIDLKEGKCVRLIQGKVKNITIYSMNPIDQAKYFQDKGAKKIHIIDLDSAIERGKNNFKIVEKIVNTLNIPIQYGGGLRSINDVKEKFDSGVNSVIFGTMAVKFPNIFLEILNEFNEDKIILGVDTKNRKIAINGWVNNTEIDDVSFALKWKKNGIKKVIYTDISRDGMLAGPNLITLKDFVKETKLNVTASGGISNINEIKNLKQLESLGITEAIIGKAFYDKKIDPIKIFNVS